MTPASVIASCDDNGGTKGNPVMVEITSDMVASVWQVVAQEGDTVEAGGVVMVLESMKMEIPVESPEDGVITKILVAKGDAVDEGETLAIIG